MFLKWRTLRYIIFGVALLVLYIFGVFHRVFELDFDKNFHYPYDGNIEVFVEQLKNDISPAVPPINTYNFIYYKNCSQKCASISNLQLVYIIKSSPEHFDRRQVIRKTWGDEGQFGSVEIRTVFVLGIRNEERLQTLVDEESQKFSDIVQANFTDQYYNNTYKTMTGIQWAVEFCPNAKFYMFVDDDYYVSSKNVLRYISSPLNYPHRTKQSTKINSLDFTEFQDNKNVRLYAGYVSYTSPIRKYMSKWYIPLKEYPYDKWPPYINSGGYILSKEALVDIYYASFYTEHFRFDDIYIGIITYKIKIIPLHCDEFYYERKPYDKLDFKNTIATHGYGDPDELLQIWTEQMNLGQA